MQYKDSVEGDERRWWGFAPAGKFAAGPHGVNHTVLATNTALVVSTQMQPIDYDNQDKTQIENLVVTIVVNLTARNGQEDQEPRSYLASRQPTRTPSFKQVQRESSREMARHDRQRLDRAWHAPEWPDDAED